MGEGEIDKGGEAPQYSYYDATPEIVPLAPDEDSVGPSDPRVLLFSQRNIERPVWHGGLYEFEDVIAGVDAVRMLAPHRETGLPGVRLGLRLVADARRHLRLPELPDPANVRVERDYDLFFALFHFVWQVSYLRQVRNWRRRCRTAVCFILEQWLADIESWRPACEMLEQFDHVFVFSRWSIPRLRELSGRPVEYLPGGVDARAACPYPSRPSRTIDIYSIGRRVPTVHETLLRLMRQDRVTYVFDSVPFGAVRSFEHTEHRDLIRHLLKRSRYFLAHRQNESPHFRAKTQGEEAIPLRYFEGIAGGPVLLGSLPDCDDYRANFDWPDATIPLPTEPAALEELLQELDCQPERLARARRNNIVNALRRHDWVYRWQSVLRAAGLPDTAALRRRIAELERLAALAHEQSADPSAA